MNLKHFGHLTRKEHQIPADVLQEIDDLAEQIDQLFKSFNKTACAACTRWPSREIAERNGEVPRGCCSGCQYSKGYFGYGDNGPHANMRRATLIKKYWVDDIYGFFNPETRSCNLPRARRSWTCTSAVCNEFKGKRNHKKKHKLVMRFISLKQKHGLLI